MCSSSLCWVRRAASSHLPQKFLVGIAVLNGTGKRVLLQQLLFAGKVHPGELDEPVQTLAHLVAPVSVDQRKANVIQRIHQDRMLIVHCLHANRARVIPGEKCHEAPVFLEAEFSEWLCYGLMQRSSL